MELELNACAEDEHDEIPGRFVRGVLHNEKEARRRWQLTKKWRTQAGTNAILDEPQQHYAVCKKFYPHYLHKTNKSGCFVYVERPGRGDMQKFWDMGITLDDLARHYVFLSEATWRMIDSRPDGMLVSIFDVEGGTINDLAGDALKLFKKCSEVIQLHYPERSFKMYVINAPWWFQAAFVMVSPFIDPRTKKKIVVLGKEYQKSLLKEIPAENLPMEYGGKDPCPLGLSPAERQIWDHVAAVNATHGIPTDDIEEVYAWQRATLMKKKPKEDSSKKANSSDIPTMSAVPQSGTTTPLNETPDEVAGTSSAPQPDISDASGEVSKHDKKRSRKIRH